jgi:hypothetical protein
MAKNFRLALRVEENLYNFTDRYAKAFNISKTEVIIKSVLKYMEITKLSDKKLQKGVKKYLKMQELRHKRRELKEFLYGQYFIKNIHEHLYRISKSCFKLYQGTFINVEQNKAIIKFAKDVFKSMPNEHKKYLKRDMLEIERWGNREYVYEQLKFLEAQDRADRFLGDDDDRRNR